MATAKKRSKKPLTKRVVRARARPLHSRRSHRNGRGDMTVKEFREALKAGQYTSVGSYPLFFITADGGALHHKCAKKYEPEIVEAIEDEDRRGGWRVIAQDVNWEDSDLRCDQCNKRIESAYGD